jgi:hypothetical protein
MTVVWLIGGLFVMILGAVLLKRRIRNLRSELHDLHGENYHILMAEMDAEESSKRSATQEPKPGLPADTKDSKPDAH